MVRDGKTIDVDVTLAVRPENVQQEQPQQAPDEQGQQAPDEQGGSGIPDGMTPEQLWEWFQQQQGGQG